MSHSSLPQHGRVNCTLCHSAQPTIFDITRREEGDWRLTANPLAWGNPNAEIVVLGFSKGPTQAGALSTSPHDKIAYKGSRLNVGKIFAHVGLIPKQDSESLKSTVDQLIADREGRFHFGSLIRCTVERYDRKGEYPTWKGTGGGMLDKFVATPFGQNVARRCSETFLGNLPSSVKLVVMFGLGTNGNYVGAARKLMEKARPGPWQTLNDVAYTDGRVTFVHVEHFASQGSLLPNWLGENNHDRARLGLFAKDGVRIALTRS